MAYRCEVYCNTGFNAVDIPDDYYTLRDNFTPWITYDDIDLIQTEYLATLRLSEIPHEVARQVDYIVIEDPDVGPEGMKRCCYTVDHFAYTSYDVVEFYLLLDAYNTFGGFKLETSGNEIISGWANRMSVSLEDDAANFYTLDEPFQPAERCEYEIQQLLDASGQCKTYVETVTIPPKIVDNALGKSLEGQEGITCPSNASGTCEGMNMGCSAMTMQVGDSTAFNYVRAIAPRSRKMNPTIFTLKGAGKTNTFHNATRIWDGQALESDPVTTKDTKEDGAFADFTTTYNVVRMFHDLERDGDIVNYWEVPQCYVEQAPDTDGAKFNATDDNSPGGLSMLSSKETNGAVNVVLPSVAGAVCNNKAKYSQSVMVKVYSPVSGESLDKSVHNICGPVSPASESLSCAYGISADPRAGGTPLFAWQYLGNTSQLGTLAESIKGGPWRNLTMNIEGASALSRDVFDTNMKLQKDLNDQQMNNSLIGGLVGVGAGIAGAMMGHVAGGIAGVVGSVGSIVHAQQSYENNSRKMQADQELFNRKSIAASTTIQVGSSNTARDLGLNTFFVIISKYSANDMFSYDTFLTQYGYNVGNKRFENKDLFTRPAFNYVRINDLQVRSLSSNIDLFEKVKEQMKMGVRLWHKKPEVQDMFPGGNR